MNYPMYKNEVQLCFDEKKHYYSVNGEYVPGTTTITGILDKPWLKWWAAKVGAERLEELLKPGVAYDELQIKDMVYEVKNAHTRFTKTAADTGTLVHDHIEKIIKAKIAKAPSPQLPFNVTVKGGVLRFLDWVEKDKVEFLGSEELVYSKKHNYAGTLDARAIVKGKLSIVDVKTSNQMDYTMLLQVSGYQLARQEEYPQEKYKQQVIVRVGKVDGGLEVKYSTDFKKDSKIFLACLAILKRQNELKNI